MLIQRQNFLQLISSSLIPIFFTQSASSTETDSPKQNIRSFLIPLSTTLAGFGLFIVLVGLTAAFIFKFTMFWKQKKEETIASEVHQAYHKNMTPIYETINNEKSDYAHTGTSINNNFGICLDTISNDQGVYYENIHSRETKCCHNTSTKIDTASNVAYFMSSEIPMQSNDSYQATCTIAKHNDSKFESHASLYAKTTLEL